MYRHKCLNRFRQILRRALWKRCISENLLARPEPQRNTLLCRFTTRVEILEPFREESPDSFTSFRNRGKSLLDVPFASSGCTPVIPVEMGSTQNSTVGTSSSQFRECLQE